MESQHGSNLKNIRKKRATAQQSIVSLSCLVCIAFAAIWGFHAGSGNSRAVEAKKMSASSSVAENESSEINADSSSQAESMIDESGIDESLTDSSVTHDDADDLSDAVFIGDSRTVGLQNNCDKPKATFLCSVGMHIDTVMTDQNITLSNGNTGILVYNLHQFMVELFTSLLTADLYFHTRFQGKIVLCSDNAVHIYNAFAQQ